MVAGRPIQLVVVKRKPRTLEQMTAAFKQHPFVAGLENLADAYGEQLTTQLTESSEWAYVGIASLTVTVQGKLAGNFELHLMNWDLGTAHVRFEANALYFKGIDTPGKPGEPYAPALETGRVVQISQLTPQGSTDQYAARPDILYDLITGPYGFHHFNSNNGKVPPDVADYIMRQIKWCYIASRDLANGVRSP